MSDNDHKPGGRRPGGRTARTRAAVLAAARAELGEGGLGALSFEAIARRSGVHLATIYRRWRTLDRLVTDMLIDWAGAALPIPDTGELLTDLRALAHGIATGYTDPANRALIEAVVAAAAREQWAAHALHDMFDTRLRMTGVVVEWAIERGELPSGTQPKEVIATMAAPIYYRMLITRQPIDGALADRAAQIAYLAARSGVLSG